MNNCPNTDETKRRANVVVLFHYQNVFYRQAVSDQAFLVVSDSRRTVQVLG